MLAATNVPLVPRLDKISSKYYLEHFIPTLNLFPGITSNNFQI